MVHSGVAFEARLTVSNIVLACFEIGGVRRSTVVADVLSALNLNETEYGHKTAGVATFRVVPDMRVPPSL